MDLLFCVENKCNLKQLKKNYSHDVPYQRRFIYDTTVLLSIYIFMELRKFYTLKANQSNMLEKLRNTTYISLWLTQVPHWRKSIVIYFSINTFKIFFKKQSKTYTCAKISFMEKSYT